MITRLWQWLFMSAGEKDGDGWIHRHPDAEVISERDTGRGKEQVLQARDGTTRKCLVDDCGNVVAVLR